MKMNILIVDDDPMSRKLLKLVLRDEGFNVVEAESIRAARTILVQDTPLLILLDVGLPDGDGLTFCKQLTQEEPNVPVILLTSRNTPNDRLSGLRLGADDYITKPCDFSEVVERVKVVLRRSNRLQAGMVQSEIRLGDLELNATELKVRIAGQNPIQLTHTEMKILRCLMLNAGTVLSRDRIAELALGYDYENASNIIDVYMLRLRKKLETSPSRPKYFETIVGIGYRMYKPAKNNKAEDKVKSEGKPVIVESYKGATVTQELSH
jgi:DNA-binding response OmpR family regulator